MSAPLESALVRTRQGWYYHTLWATSEGHRVRVKIKTDSYDFQSSAVAEVWSATDLRWNEAARLHYADMDCAGMGAHTKEELVATTAEEDLNRLLVTVMSLPGIGTI